jgi:hypothetical protein
MIMMSMLVPILRRQNMIPHRNFSGGWPLGERNYLKKHCAVAGTNQIKHFAESKIANFLNKARFYSYLEGLF